MERCWKSIKLIEGELNHVIVNTSFSSACLIAWRVLLLLVWAAWWGGLCFYAVIVVPIGTEAIGSVEQGFITQRVTQWHNALTGLFSIFLLVEAYRKRERVFWIIAISLSLIATALVLQHARLTGMMDFKHQTVPGGFYGSHAVYLWITAIEWALGIVIAIWLLPTAAGVRSQSK